MEGTVPRKKWMKKEVRMVELFSVVFRVRNERIFVEGGGGGWGERTYVSTRMLMKY